MRFALLLLLLKAVSAPAQAHYELALGAVDEIDGLRGELLMVSWPRDHARPFELFAGYLHRSRPVEPDERSSTAFPGGGMRIYWRGFYLASGLMLVERTTAALTSHGQFVSGIGYGDDRFSTALRHISNANTSGHNRGENLLTFSWHW